MLGAASVADRAHDLRPQRRLRQRLAEDTRTDPSTVTKPGVGFARAARARGGRRALPGEEETPHAVKRGIQALTGERRTALFIDEFDRLSDDDRLLFADTIKTLSDQLPTATIVLIGVADDVEH